MLLATRRGANGQFPPPKFSKVCLIVRYNKLPSFCPDPENIIWLRVCDPDYAYRNFKSYNMKLYFMPKYNKTEPFQ